MMAAIINRQQLKADTKSMLATARVSPKAMIALYLGITIVLDLIVLQIAFVLAYILWHGWVNPYQYPIYVSMNAFLLMCDLVIIFFTEPFRNVLKRGYYREMEALLQQTLFIVLFAVLFLFAQRRIVETMAYSGIKD